MTQSFTPSRVSMASLLGVCVLLAPVSASAQDAIPLECLPGSTGPTSGDATPYGGGMCDLGSLRTNSAGYSAAWHVSADGTVIAGYSQRNTGNYSAFRWIDDGTGMLDLGTLGGSISYTNAISPNGKVIVGTSYEPQGNSRAFLWIDDGRGMRDLGSLRPDNLGRSDGRAVSVEGSVVVVVGQADTKDGASRAFRWIDDGKGMRDLGSLRPDDLGASIAVNVSANGAVIVGQADTKDGASRAFLWIDDEKGMRDLGSLRPDNFGDSETKAVSANGAVIVGQADTKDGSGADGRAFRWIDDEKGMRDLGSLRADNLGKSTAYAVSADGAVIVGEAETDSVVRSGVRLRRVSRAFIWRTQMQDLENLMLSFPRLVNDTEIAVTQQQGVVSQLANQTCLAATGASCMRSSLIGNSTDGTSSDDIGPRSSLTGLISYGYGVSEGWTLGGTLSIGSTSLNNNGFDMGSDLGAALWGRYSEGQLARTGWQGEVALGYGRASGDITRGRGLDNVLLSTGETDMDTRLARASLGYGFNQAQGWLLTPTLGITHTRTTRGAYTETGGDFNASYDSLTINRTTMDLSLSAETAINDVSRLTLTGGLEHDLSADRVVLTGTSDMPGMETFAVGSTLDRRDTRGFFAAEYAYDLSATQTISGSLRVGQAAYGSKPQVGLGVHFGMKF